MTAAATELPTTVPALRSLAKDLGLKGMSAAKKDALVPAITEELERRAVAERAAAQAGKAPKLCVICGKRRPTSKNGKSFNDQCDPCHVEAGWENTHSDANHAAVLAVAEAERTERRSPGAGSASQSSVGRAGSRLPASPEPVR
ncbi:Rho termination factor N-terminal domain-containing protein [Actinoplanes sp. M2I2]|uniref:Rho termination factor N-terminal domain-containing protein n=1 Tax=Actinoplanes sp. M2I2 TaxID=1734444 RepID=UPI00202149D0|nr:Rho termination factor N-terminal domain-containing protein [Actinoplanes sp. M2I2]